MAAKIEAKDFRTPGQFVKALIDSKGWTHRVLAIVLGVEETAVYRLVTDRRSVDAGMALVLGEIFEVRPEAFLELQKSYDLAKARITSRPDPGRSSRALLHGALPIAEMIKRGWLEAEDSRDVPRVEAELAKFFGVKTPEEIEILPHAAKKTNVASDVTPAQLAWFYRVKQIASDMLVPRYSHEKGRTAIGRLSALLAAPEEARKAPRILAESGIRFAIVESLSSAKIDGVCFWLNALSPVVGMSLRHDRIDNFWFVLRHELEHVLQQHGNAAAIVDSELEGERAGTGPDIAEEERIANYAAADFCVPSEKMDRFIARKSPFFAERDVLGFARTINVHPGLVAGQLQRRTGRYELFRKHLVKIKSSVAPSAVVDGWGDVAPVGH